MQEKFSEKKGQIWEKHIVFAAERNNPRLRRGCNFFV